MDEKLIEQLLTEEIPEWEYEDLKFSKEKKIANFNGDNGSVYTDGDDDVDSCKMHSPSNAGGVTMSSTNDIMSVHSSTGTPVWSPQSQKRLYARSNMVPMSMSSSRDDGSVHSILSHRTGRLIKHSILTKVANQISASSKSRANSGNPTCCARGKFLAIGTSKGITFLFDLKQVLKFYVGSEQECSTFGAVSTLSFNMGSTRLLVGFVKAHINMWDISGSEGKLLRSINANQGPGYAVSFVRFLPDPTMAVYADTNGSVFQLIFKRGISGRSTDLECFFSGSRGEILCLEALFIPKHTQKHELEEYSLLAMASFTKVIIVSCKPQLKVKYMHPLKGKPDTMPQVEWSHNTRLSSSDTVSNREVFLTFARHSEVHILKITCTNNAANDIALEFHGGDLKFELVFHMNLNVQILSVKWMNQYFLGVLDFDEQFHAIDMQTKTIVESLGMKSAQIVYNTSLFKSTATGGNVSEAMSVAAERACYHSVVELNGQIKILGQEMHILMLRPWMEAVDVARHNQGPENAFKICAELYRGNNLSCRQVLMLPSKNEDRQRAVTKVALSLIESILASPPTYLDFHSFFSSMLDLCVAINQINFFKSTVFSKLTNNGEMEVAFIRTILPLILNSTVNELHPELVQRIVDYLQSTAQLAQLDCCITKLNISCLDLDQIIKLATKHHLYSSFIHIYNSAFNDFLTPIQFMINFISNTTHPSGQHELLAETVIKAIVYIHCCFAGKGFFSGNDLSPTIVEQVQLNIFDYLIPFERRAETKSLNVLLKYNTNEFLNMITLAFDEPFFLSDIGISRKQATLQRLCDYFTTDRMSSSNHESIRFFVFLSRELNKSSNVSVYIDQTVLDELIERVCLGINDDTLKGEQKRYSTTAFLHKQAETAFLNFFKSNSTYQDYWLKNERILTLSRKAQFYRVCEFIYRQKMMLHMVLECFLLDPDYRIEAFDLIESAWNDENIDDHQRSEMVDKCFQLADCLILANCSLSVVVLLTICKKRLDEVIEKLGGFHSSVELQNQHIYTFLKSFFVIRNEIDLKESDYENHTAVSQEISSTIKSLKVPSQISELFINLLCKFESDYLLIYLKNSVDYRNENAIGIISKYNLPYPLGFLYEKSKKFSLASDLYIKIFNDLWQKNVENADLTLEKCLISSEIGDSFRQCIDIFVRLVNKSKSNSSEIENCWSVMLNSILQKQVCSRKKPSESLIEIIFNYFMKILSNEVPMSTIMVTILKNPVFNGQNFGKIRELVISMMNSFNYEEVLLESCIALMDKDITDCVQQLQTTMGTGVLISDLKCSICLRDLGTNDIVTFRCGHQFHGDCSLKSSVSTTGVQCAISDDSDALCCPLCHINISSKYFAHSQLSIRTASRRASNVDHMKPNTAKVAKNSRGLELVSPDISTPGPTSTPHYNTVIDFSNSRKKMDIPIKLNLAPPNYLLNYCTLNR